MHRVRRPRALVLPAIVGLCLLPALGQAQRQPAPASERSDATCTLTAFRVRADFEAVLNAGDGWAGGTNEAVTLEADRPFRLRVELETADAAEQARRFWLQYRRNHGPWTDLPAADFPYPLGVTPPISVVANGEYAPGEATADLLAGATAPFRAGTGLVLEATTPTWQGGRVHGEWEWPLVIRRFSDGAATSETGDVFELRMAGTPGACASVASPRLTLAVPPGLLGGTFVETPGPIGPWQAANGDLYFTIEPAETTNVLMMVKSSDGGRTWREVDGARRPVTGDLEGVAATFDGDTVHILHQTSEDVWHHAFRTSDHPTHPDTWAIRDERLASPVEPPTQVAALAARSDGSLVGVYGGPDRLHVRIRGADGTWGEEAIVDAGSGPRLSGPMAVTGRDDVVHLAYTGHDGTAWYRTVAADGTLGARQRVSDRLARGSGDVGSVLPLVYLPEDDTLVVIYRTADGRLRARRAVAGAPLGEERVVTDRVVVQNAVDADQTGADAIALDGAAHVLFIDAASGSLFHTSSDPDGSWRDAVLQQDDVDAQWVRGQAVRRADGTTVYGYVFDAGSNGGSGMNRYGEVAPAAAVR
ncbi:MULTISPECIES: sialidase family protein [Luteimonas]|uniref:sialidase family protein n=1 Tax=Luteimonas TaxID=83614 RepID=UPI000C7AE4C5|nr:MULTISPECIES: sialidase family protein [Luteimonas]